MTRMQNLLVGALVATGLGAAATAGLAATIIDPITGGPFSSANPVGGVPTTQLLQADTYDFTFSLVAPPGGPTSTQIQAQIAGGTAEPISFSLYSGTPTGAHDFITTSPTADSSVLAEDLMPGSYYINITPSQIAINREVLSGSLIASAVPEPASWAMMIVGMSLVGGAMRQAGRRRLGGFASSEVVTLS